jgi:hypothetical protein
MDPRACSLIVDLTINVQVAPREHNGMLEVEIDKYKDLSWSDLASHCPHLKYLLIDFELSRCTRSATMQTWTSVAQILNIRTADVVSPEPRDGASALPSEVAVHMVEPDKRALVLPSDLESVTILGNVAGHNFTFVEKLTLIEGWEFKLVPDAQPGQTNPWSHTVRLCWTRKESARQADSKGMD